MAHAPHTSTSNLLTAAEFGGGTEDIIIRDPTSSSFKPLKTIIPTFFQILLNLALVLESFLFVKYWSGCSESAKNETTDQHDTSNAVKVDCTVIFILSSVAVLLTTWILKVILHYIHRHHRRSGYLRFNAEIYWFTKVPFHVMVLGNSVLLVTLTLKVAGQFPSSPEGKFPESPMWLLIQIVSGVEFLVVVIFLIVYIVKVCRFNRMRPEPDVFYRNNLASMPVSTNRVMGLEIGPGLSRGSTNHLQELRRVCDLQADLIDYLRHRCDVLSARLHRIDQLE